MGDTWLKTIEAMLDVSISESVKNVHENTDISGIWPFCSVKKPLKYAVDL